MIYKCDIPNYIWNIPYYIWDEIWLRLMDYKPRPAHPTG